MDVILTACAEADGGGTSGCTVSGGTIANDDEAVEDAIVIGDDARIGEDELVVEIGSETDGCVSRIEDNGISSVEMVEGVSGNFFISASTHRLSSIGFRGGFAEDRRRRRLLSAAKLVPRSCL